MPTVHSFLALFRMLCVYYPTKTTLANANVEDQPMSLLTSYKDCMLHRFKKDQKETKQRKEALKDGLAKGIKFLDSNVYNIGAYKDYIDDVVYDLAGYLLHARRKMVGSCSECWKSLESDEPLTEHSNAPNTLNVLRDRGGLKKVTPNMFFVVSSLETMLIKHFKESSCYLRDSFENVIGKASLLSLHNICCPTHRDTLAPKLIYE